MTKILMILTSHRLDCLKICMEMLVRGGAIRGFDRVVMLMNGVRGRHLRWLQAFMQQHPDIPWDTISGPRGRGKRISGLQNQCVERYPDSLYFKIDEDTFVSPDCFQKMEAAYHEVCDDPDLSLITPLITNNALGFYHLMELFPEKRKEYEARFTYPVVPRCDGPVWYYPKLAEWAIRSFLNLAVANDELERRVSKDDRLSLFHERFSINCICYDYKHWKEIGGVQTDDEIGWGEWIAQNKKTVVVVKDALVHHYSFFVQQDWLDRTHLLEDLRITNLPGTLSEKNWFQYACPRYMRIARQLPSIIKRRLGAK